MWYNEMTYYACSEPSEVKRQCSRTDTMAIYVLLNHNQGINFNETEAQK